MSARHKIQSEFLWGIHPVREALLAGRRRIYEIHIVDEKGSERLLEITDRAAALKIPIRKTAPDGLKRLTGSGRHQGVAASVGPLPLIDIFDLYDRISAPSAAPLILILDGIEDPHNLGALVRTALCAGADGIIIPRDRSASPTPAVSRASAGALEHAPICQVTNLANTIRDLKKNGVWIVGLDRKGDRSIYNTEMSGACALVVGGEDTGIRRLIAEQCDFLCHIPQAGAFNSLNASVAGAVAMYEAFRQRQNR